MKSMVKNRWQFLTALVGLPLVITLILVGCGSASADFFNQHYTEYTNYCNSSTVNIGPDAKPVYNNPYIAGKALIAHMHYPNNQPPATALFDNLTNSLPDEIRAVDPSEVGTIVCISETSYHDDPNRPADVTSAAFLNSMDKTMNPGLEPKQICSTH
jgi:hypothetical protein